MRKIADAAAAAAIEEGVATLVAPIEARPGSGSGSGSGSRSGTAKGAANHSGENSGNRPATGTGTRGAGSPRKPDWISSAVQVGKQSKAEHAAMGSKVQKGMVTTANRSTKGRLGGAEAKVVGPVKETVAAETERLQIVSTAGFRPADQRLLVFLQQYVLVNSQAGREVSQHKRFEFIFVGKNQWPSCTECVAKQNRTLSPLWVWGVTRSFT